MKKKKPPKRRLRQEDGWNNGYDTGYMVAYRRWEKYHLEALKADNERLREDIMGGFTPKLSYKPTQKEMLQLAMDAIRQNRYSPFKLIYDKPTKTIIAINVEDKIKELEVKLPNPVSECKYFQNGVCYSPIKPPDSPNPVSIEDLYKFLRSIDGCNTEWIDSDWADNVDLKRLAQALHDRIYGKFKESDEITPIKRNKHRKIITVGKGQVEMIKDGKDFDLNITGLDAGGGGKPEEYCTCTNIRQGNI